MEICRLCGLHCSGRAPSRQGEIANSPDPRSTLRPQNRQWNTAVTSVAARASRSTRNRSLPDASPVFDLFPRQLAIVLCQRIVLFDHFAQLRMLLNHFEQVLAVVLR